MVWKACNLQHFSIRRDRDLLTHFDSARSTLRRVTFWLLFFFAVCLGRRGTGYRLGARCTMCRTPPVTRRVHFKEIEIIDTHIYIFIISHHVSYFVSYLALALPVVVRAQPPRSRIMFMTEKMWFWFLDWGTNIAHP